LFGVDEIINAFYVWNDQFKSMFFHIKKAIIFIH